MTRGGAREPGLACEACGQLPHPHRVRLTLAKLGSVLPIELALHALVLALHPGYLASAVLLAVSTTVLVIWVVEPSALRLLGRWLHAPALRERRTLHEADALWRLRVVLRDEPGSLERVTHELAALPVSILSLHVHPLEDGVLDELVLGGDASLRQEDILEAAARGGGQDVRIWPTTALSLLDGQTRALNLAALVAHRPEELPTAVAELLDATLVTDHLAPGRRGGDQGTLLRIPSPWSGLFTFTRPDSPFTPAERARAARLAQIAEAATLGAATSRLQDPGAR